MFLWHSLWERYQKIKKICSIYVLTVLDECFDCARPMFRLCSRYVSTFSIEIGYVLHRKLFFIKLKILRVLTPSFDYIFFYKSGLKLIMLIFEDIFYLKLWNKLGFVWSVSTMLNLFFDFLDLCFDFLDQNLVGFDSLDQNQVCFDFVLDLKMQVNRGFLVA